jgi:hypothetical protein
MIKVDCETNETANTDDICPDCNVKMEQDRFKYICKLCGLVEECTDNHHIEERVESQQMIYSGPYKNHPQWSIPDKAKTQQQAILRYLCSLAAKYDGPEIPNSVLHTVTNYYNQLQSHGNVWRGSIKKEILATLIELVCIKNNIFHKKANIAKFMELQADGYAKGECILRDRISVGCIELETDSNALDSIIDKFLKNIGITDKKYEDYIKDIIDTSVLYNIGLDFAINSKVAGVLLYLKMCKRIDISDTELEVCTENIKKGTFKKFYKKMLDYCDIFIPIYEKYFYAQL